MRLLSFILLLGTTILLGAAPRICVVCQKPIVGKAYYKKMDGQTNYVCELCTKLPTRCSLCDLPAGEGSVRTEDGRIFCRLDAPKVVLVEAEAQQIFRATRDELERLFAGVMS